MKNKSSIKEFDQKARDNGMRYAEAQIKETLEMAEPIRVPPGYRKVGERTIEEILKEGQ